MHRLFFFYKTDVEGTGTLFTPERLVSICEVEKTMLANNSLVKEPLLCFIALWIVDLLTLAFLVTSASVSVHSVAVWIARPCPLEIRSLVSSMALRPTQPCSPCQQRERSLVMTGAARSFPRVT